LTKILITGAGGFIGSHLAELCLESEIEVVAFDRYNSDNSWGWLESSKYQDEMEIILGDIRDYDSVSKAMKGCSAVFHLAALIGIPYSYVSPLAYIRTNVEGTYNVLEAAKNQELEQVIITSTSETYGTAQYTPINEKHPLVGQSPYAASKIAADQLALSYFRSFSLPVKIVRPFNTYGPRQSSRAVIPTIISQVLNNSKEIKLGSMEPTRDMTFVKDTCAAFLKIYGYGGFLGEVTNIGMNSEVSIGQLAIEIKSIMGIDIPTVIEKSRIRPTNSEVERLVCNNEKLLKHTSWEPRYTLRTGLSETISWLENQGQYKKADFYQI